MRPVGLSALAADRGATVLIGGAGLFARLLLLVLSLLLTRLLLLVLACC
jgi:hypothetical protein